MAIAIVGGTAWVAGTTSAAPTIHASTAAGHMMILFMNGKPFSGTIVTPTGWELVEGSNGTNGSTASGIDTGSVQWAAFWRLWQPGDGTPTVPFTSGSVCLAVINSFSKSVAGSRWAVPIGAKGSDITSGTGFSLTMDVDPGITVGDRVTGSMVLAGNNATFGSPAMTATSATFGAVAEPQGEGATAQGDDLESISFHANCDAGTASAAAVTSATLSIAQTGGGCIVRLREVVLPNDQYNINTTVARASIY